MHKRITAFTIVELLVVIVIIGILATVTIVSYSSLSSSATQVSANSDLANAKIKLQAYNSQYGSYPASLDSNGCPVASGSLPADANYCIKVKGSNPTSDYIGYGNYFTLKTLSNSITYYITDSLTPANTTIYDGTLIQNITTANCPPFRLRAVDARDNKTYWVQKLADNRCWMLTNLAYAGGGSNTFGDVKTLSNGTSDISMTYTVAKYYVIPNTTNFTTEPANPTTSTNGTGQLGYLYNWCAVMGGQATAACSNAATPTPNPNISICPSGWRPFKRLNSSDPNYPSGDEYYQLRLALGNGSLNWPVTNFYNIFLFQNSGLWDNGTFYASSWGEYASSIQSSWIGITEGQNFNVFRYGNSGAVWNYEWNGELKSTGTALRCIAN